MTTYQTSTGDPLGDTPRCRFCGSRDVELRGQQDGRAGRILTVRCRRCGLVSALTLTTEGRTMTRQSNRDRRVCRDAACHVAMDAMASLIGWCRDPIVAETQQGNEAFFDAIRLAEIALERVGHERMNTRQPPRRPQPGG